MARHRSHGPIVPSLLVGALAVFLVSPLSAQEEVPAEGGRRLTTDTEAPPVEEACGAESPAGFSPGQIDGRWGRNTRGALEAYQRARGER